MNSPEPKSDLAPVAEALYQGHKIEAIKQYRELHGCGLKEAKGAVEELEAGLRTATPEKFKTASSGAGCLGMLLAGCVFATCLLVILSGL